MTYEKYIDHTLLKANAREEDFKKLCSEANEFNFFSVCIPASYISFAKEQLKKDVKICTVVGFPLGSSLAKEEETQKAIDQGADEIDMVINISKLLSLDFSYIENEISKISKKCQNKILKVIIETDYLDESLTIQCCNILNNTNAQYIKTSTGFADSGAQLSDIHLFKKHLDSSKKIKASGGIRNAKDFKAFISAGADRIGTSSGVKIISDMKC